MAWPLIKLLPKKTNIGFVQFARPAAIVSVLLVIASFASFFTGGFRDNPAAVYAAAEGGPIEKAGAVLANGFALGIDFKGGAVVEIEAPHDIDLEAVRNAVDALGIGDVQVQSYSPTVDDGKSHATVSFQTGDGSDDEGAESDEALTDRVSAEIRNVVPDVTIAREDVVGAKVSGELFTSGLLALGLAIGLMLIYIWFRFESRFGAGAVVALFHDVILTLGLFSLFRIEFTLTIIAALLTIIGYSMNDTVVVFDRLRENYRKFKRTPRPEVIDLSINETLSRTIMTSVTSLLAAVALWVFGGKALEGFAIAMTFGIFIGTYSSVYVASPATLLWAPEPGGDPAGGERLEAEQGAT